MQKGENPETGKKIVDFAHIAVLYYKCWGSRRAVFFAAKNKKRPAGAAEQGSGGGSVPDPAAAAALGPKCAKKELTLDSVSLHSVKGQFSEFLLSNII